MNLLNLPLDTPGPKTTYKMIWARIKRKLNQKKPGQTHCWIAHFWFTVINNTSWKWWNMYTALTGNFQTDMRKYHKNWNPKPGHALLNCPPLLDHSAFAENLQNDLRKDQKKLTQNKICLMQMTNAGITQWLKASKMAWERIKKETETKTRTHTLFNCPSSVYQAP